MLQNCLYTNADESLEEWKAKFHKPIHELQNEAAQI